MDETKLPDSDMLRQLSGAVSARECSPQFAVEQAYALGVITGRLMQAKQSLKTVREPS